MSDNTKLDQAWETYKAEALRTNSLVLLRHAFDAGAQAMAEIMRDRMIDTAVGELCPPSCTPVVCSWTEQTSCTQCARVTLQHCYSLEHDVPYRQCSECGHKSLL